ncbi:MAG TPA: peptidoglycan-binding protein, partial [Symbiobacteriaceae bacterium]|nr:peptidoglycan-binding protein [Symbiobacteriaceae bacterium]
MTAIIWPLEPNMKGLAVVNLQDALLFLMEKGALLAYDEGLRKELTAGLQAERADQAYGDATAELVAYFQRERKLEASGYVDAATADAMNQVLQQLGALTPAAGTIALDTRYAVPCQVIDVRNQPIAGLRLALFDQDPLSPHD